MHTPDAAIQELNATPHVALPPDAVPQSEAATLVRWIAWAAATLGATRVAWTLIGLPNVLSDVTFRPRDTLGVLMLIGVLLTLVDFAANAMLALTGIGCLRGAGPTAVRWLSRAAIAVVIVLVLNEVARLDARYRYSHGFGGDSTGVLLMFALDLLAKSLLPAALWLIARHPACARLLGGRPA